MSERKVYGYLVFRQWKDKVEVHRMAIHSPYESSTVDRIMDGIDQQMDHERLYYEWEDAS